jgi:hypothetical protein
MEMNVENTKVMRMSRQKSPLQIMTTDQKQMENVAYLNYMSSMITNDARCTREIKSRIAMAKAAVSKKKKKKKKKTALVTSQLDLNLRKKPVKCYVWGIALYGAETWTLRKVDQKYVGRLEMWCWRRSVGPIV